MRIFYANQGRLYYLRPRTHNHTLHKHLTRLSDANYRAVRNAERSSFEKAVRPSVCLSNAWIVTKRKKDLSKFLYHRNYHFA